MAEDEYTAQETQDGYDAVAWLAAQPRCSGSVGMWGISYGGFTAIQVAALRPPALKAIVPVYATDDRYTDDVHYIGGCAAASELAQYAVGMVAMNALPPRASYARDAWSTLRTAERIALTVFHDDPADARVTNAELYELSERGYTTRVRSAGTIGATETDFHVDLQLEVDLNGRPFFHKAWLESIPQELV